MKTNRVNEIVATMKSFSKDKYQKNELLPEMFALQQEIVGLERLIKEAECKEAYPLEFDVVQYKIDFATLMAILEETSAKAEEQEYKQEVVIEKKNIRTVLENVFTSRYVGYAGSAAVAAVATFISTVAISAIREADNYDNQYFEER